MANPQHLEIIFQGYTYWNEWRQEHPEIHPDLSNAFLTSAEIEGTALNKTRSPAFLLCIASAKSSSVGPPSSFFLWLPMMLPQGDKRTDDLWLDPLSRAILLTKGRGV